MQKFCIWKLDTKYLKLTASSYSLSQNCKDTSVSSRSPNVGVHDLVTESQQTALGGKRKAQEGEKNSVCFKCPYYSCICVWNCRFITWMTLRSKKKKRKKEKKKETRFLKFNKHKNARVVTKISNCRVNTTSRGEIRQLGISFGSIFLLFSYESIWRKFAAPAS